MNSFGPFAQCMIENDRDVERDERRTRGLGWLLSLALQTSLVAALVVLPLLTPAVLPRIFSVVRVPNPPLLRPPVVVQEDPVPPAELTTTRIYLNSAVSRPLPPSQPRFPSTDTGGDALPELPPNTTAPFDAIGAQRQPQVAPPPAPPAVRGPMKAPSTVMEAMLINRVEPSYPTAARVLGLYGKVVLSAVIGTDGAVRSLRVVSGHPILARAAVGAVQNWRYKPTLLNGQPVEVETLITVDFQLDR